MRKSPHVHTPNTRGPAVGKEISPGGRGGRGRNKGSSRGNTFILHVSMLSTGHISSGINFCRISALSAAAGWYGWRVARLIWSVILYSCEIKRTGRDYNRPRKNRELQKWKRWKPAEIISPAPTCTEESVFLESNLRAAHFSLGILWWSTIHTLCRPLMMQCIDNNIPSAASINTKPASVN